jgi:large repetitive protein
MSMKKTITNLAKACCTLLLLSAFMLINNLNAQIIMIDGDPTDWGSGNPALTYVPDPWGNVVDNGYTQGSKDFFLAADKVWEIGQTKGKNDIANAAAYLYVAPGMADDTLYFAGDRAKTQGVAMIGFWFFLNGTKPVPIPPGSNVSNFAPPHAVGDLLILADFTNGGRYAAVSIYQWVGVGNGNAGSNLSLLFLPNYAGAVAQNNDAVYPVPTGWSYPSATYPLNAFYEGKLAIPKASSYDPCDATWLLETRSSASITASLDDFVAGSFNLTPDPPVLTGGSLCGPGQICLTATAPAGLTIKWYDALPPMVPVHIGPTYCVNLSSSQQFWATASDGVCESDPSAGVWAYIYPVPTLSCVPTNPDCWDGTGSITAMASGGTAPYTYTLLPGSVTNSTGIFTGLSTGNYTVIVTDANMCADTCDTQITVPQYNPVVLNCPSNQTLNSCDYTLQSQIDALYNTWINSFSYTGGTSPSVVITECSPAKNSNLFSNKSDNNNEGESSGLILETLNLPSPPSVCGGQVCITYTVNDICAPYVSTCTRTFTVTPPPAVTFTAPGNSTTGACSYADQAAANAAFNAWLGSYTVGGGCSPMVTYGTPVAPNYCGGTTSVTYSVTDLCYTTTTHVRTFSITAPPAVTFSAPGNSTTGACSYADQAAANAAFNAWLGSYTVGGGCSPMVTYGTPVAPDYCGGTTSVTYSVTDKCYTTTTHVRTFTITAPPAVTFTAPGNSTTGACSYADQAAANAAFNAWLGSYTVGGGCSPMVTYGTPVAPDYCGGTTSVTYSVTDKCYTTTTHVRTFTITAPPAVTFTAPGNSTTSACSYADQAAANAAFNAWLGSYTVGGGCSPMVTYGSPVPPNFCGGTTSVTYSVTDKCYTTTTHVRTFTITAPPAVTFAAPGNSTTGACSYADQAAANAAFNAWLGSYTVGGGCSPMVSYGSPVAPNYCGGTTSVTYSVTDKCYTTTTHVRTFTITAPPAVTFTAPGNSTTGACSYADQAAANAAFNAWLGSYTVGGGCSPVVTFGSPVAPPYCGGTTSVTYSVTDKCYTTTTHVRTFTITAPPAVTFTAPGSSTTNACIYADQAAANAAFNTWLGSYTVGGGCSPVVTYGSPVAPPYCGGTTSVTYTVTDKCYTTTTHLRTFTITPPPPVVVVPVSNLTTNACTYANQAAANTAFNLWLNGFSVSGGCSPQFMNGSPVAPNYCGGTTNVVWTVTDKCYTTSTHTASFIITAPPSVNFTAPGNSTTGACSYADQAAANAAFNAWVGSYTVGGGCSPMVTYGTPVPPPYCGGTTSVTYTVTDKCYTTTTHVRTFTITAPPSVNFTAPGNSTTSACSYADQAAANAAFNAWVGSYTVGGGCSPMVTYGTPVAPNYCGGTTSVTYSVTDKCYTTTTHVRTFTITAPPPVNFTPPNNSTTSACSYANQAAANAAFNTWLTNYVVPPSGGCNPQVSYGIPTAPAYCGGTTNVIYTVTDKCYTTTTYSRSFTITAPPAVTFTAPGSSTTNACSYADQAAANAAFNAWLGSYTVGGGCSPVVTYGSPVPPPYCGGTTSVTYSVTDKCYTTTTYARSFTITAPPSVNFTAPGNSTSGACSYADQAAANSAFNTWLGSYTVGGGCSPMVTYGTPVAPNYCGGTTSVTYSVTDKCYTTTTHVRTFTITPPPQVFINYPANKSINTCDYPTQQLIDAEFASWLGTFSVIGGCNPQYTVHPNPVVAPHYCGGSTTVYWNVTDHCAIFPTMLNERTFTVVGPTPVVMNCPSSISVPPTPPTKSKLSGSAGSRTKDSDPFNSWIAQFSMGGGCAPDLTIKFPSPPDPCGDTVPVIWIVTDICFIDSCEAMYIVEPGGSIGDFVWHDMNQNGIQDAGEPGIPNVGVHLSGDHTASTVTDAGGYYIFDCLPAGTYNVTFDSPGPDWYESPALQGMDVTVDSDPVGGVVMGIVLGVGVVNRSVDAGFFQQNNVFCSLTQGGYGNAGGKYCDQGTYQLIDSLLTAFGPLVVGIPMNNNTFTVPVNGAQCVIDILPGGGPNAVLSGNLGCGNFGNLLSLQGTLKNNLLAQSIVMQLNLWWNPDLGSFLLVKP